MSSEDTWKNEKQNKIGIFLKTHNSFILNYYYVTDRNITLNSIPSLSSLNANGTNMMLHRRSKVYIYIYIYIYTHTYIYTHIHTHI